MYCQKCGTKVAEGAGFCQKCGAKLIQDGAATQAPVEFTTPVAESRDTSTAKSVKQQVATPVEIQEAYNRLKESAERCPKIKKSTISKGANGASGSSLIIHGLFYRYVYTPSVNPDKSSMSWSLRWILYLVYFPILLCDALFLQFFFQGKYYLALTLCCILGCLIWFPILFFAYKEKKEITSHINETLDCQFNLPSKVSLIVTYVLNFIEIGLCVAALIFGIVSSKDVPAAAFDHTSSTTVEDISLSQSYANEDEGFSFMYPSNWTVENVEEVDPAAFVSVASTGMFGIYSRISVSKAEIDETIFSAAKSDFEILYSLTDGLHDVEVMDMTDVTLSGYPARKVTVACTNDDGASCVLIQYFYNLNFNTYAVSCMSIKESFDRYEPIIDAVMGSYTITTANTSGESGTESSYPSISYGYEGISIDYLLESVDNVIFQLGDSQLNDEFKLRYDDLEFYHDNGTITSIVCTAPSLLEADGVPLNKNREGLISIFGQPHEEGNDGGGYFMSYDLPNCSLYFELGEPDSEAWRISISPNEAIEPAPGELLYNGEPIAHLLGRKPEELDNVFGAPTGGTSVDGSLFFGGTEYYSYDDIYFTSEQGYIDTISGDASHMTVNGTTLDKDRAGIIALFGEPVLEEDVPGFEDEGIADCHVMQYNLNEYMYVVSIELPDVNSKATSVSISLGEVSP